MKEGKEADNTTSSQEPCNGPQPLQSKATSEHSQQEASFGGTIPQVRLSFWCTSCPLFYLDLLVIVTPHMHAQRAWFSPSISVSVCQSSEKSVILHEYGQG